LSKLDHADESTRTLEKELEISKWVLCTTQPNFLFFLGRLDS
jgi:hypothetical protein